MCEGFGAPVMLYICVMLSDESYRHYRLATAFSVLMILVAAAFVWWFGKDQSFLIINKYNSPRFDYFFTYFTYLGDGAIWVPLFVYILLWKRDFFLAAVVALVVCTVFTHLLKRVVFPHEFRPIMVLKDRVHIIEGLTINRLHSFPSGHTSTAFTLMLLLVFIIRRRFWTFFFPLVAFFVGYSRVYLAQHFVTDVLVGMMIGIISSFLAILVYDYYRRKKAAAAQENSNV